MRRLYRTVEIHRSGSCIRKDSGSHGKLRHRYRPGKIKLRKGRKDRLADVRSHRKKLRADVPSSRRGRKHSGALGGIG